MVLFKLLLVLNFVCLSVKLSSVVFIVVIVIIVRSIWIIMILNWVIFVYI